MKRNKPFFYIVFVLLVSTLFSCLKEDKKLAPHQPGDVIIVVIDIEYPYTNQVFYKCETNEIVSSNSKFDWDLAFESNGNHVRLNLARAMFASKAGKGNFDQVNSINGAIWLWDNSNGNLDSLALNSWIEDANNIFIIDRSFDNDGNHLGYYKIQFLSENSSSYTFKFAKLDGTEAQTYTLLKNPNTNFTSFSFDQGGKTLNIEPDSDNWDLEFTNLQYKFSNLPLPFVLTQCISNSYNGVLTAEGNDNKFVNIQLEDTINFNFTSYEDEIGYDWKIRNGVDNSYEIDPNKYFIVKTKTGFFYKIRFVDFYNNVGVKGYPKFEIQKL